jgi:hypothetical protein
MMEHIGHRDGLEGTDPKREPASVCHEVHISAKKTSDWIASGANSEK